MKFRPSLLFYILALLSLVCIPLTNSNSIDTQTGNTYYVITYFHYFAIIFILSLFTGLAYTLMTKIGRPISSKTAIIHFSLVVIGLIFSLNFYSTIVTYSIGGVFPDTAAIGFDKGALIVFLSGPLLLTIGLFVFLYGLLKAISRKTNVY